MATCLCCGGLKTLPGMGMISIRKCDACRGTGKAQDDEVFTRTTKHFKHEVELVPDKIEIIGKAVEISHPAESLPVEDAEIKRANDKKKVAKSKSKFKWKD